MTVKFMIICASLKASESLGVSANLILMIIIMFMGWLFGWRGESGCGQEAADKARNEPLHTRSFVFLWHSSIHKTKPWNKSFVRSLWNGEILDGNVMCSPLNIYLLVKTHVYGSLCVIQFCVQQGSSGGFFLKKLISTVILVYINHFSVQTVCFSLDWMQWFIFPWLFMAQCSVATGSRWLI